MILVAIVVEGNNMNGDKTNWYQKWTAMIEQDPEYQAASAELKLTLDIADRILALRLERGWSQADLARKLNVTTLYINKLESATSSPTILMLENLAAALGIGLQVELQPATCYRCGRPVCETCGEQWWMRWFCAGCLVEQKAEMSEQAAKEAGWDEAWDAVNDGKMFTEVRPE